MLPGIRSCYRFIGIILGLLKGGGGLVLNNNAPRLIQLWKGGWPQVRAAQG
jgi:hypothetical protein